MNKAEELADKISQELKVYDWNRVSAWIRKVNPDSPSDAPRYTEMLNLEGRCTFYGWLACLTKLTQPKRVVEIGADRGTSADFFLSELPEKSVLYSCDFRECWEYVPSWDSRIIKVLGEDLVAFEKLADHWKDVDIWFVDSDHTPEHVTKVMKEVFKLAKPGSIIVNHDVYEFGLTEIIKAYPCDYWDDNRKVFENGVSLQVV